MINLIRQLFGLTDTTARKEIELLKIALHTSRKEMIVLSNIVGKLASKVDKLAIASNQLTVEVDKLVNSQLELEYENTTLIEGLRSISGPKNRLIAFPIGKDDDDDLIN